jgi:hypothetical protein
VTFSINPFSWGSLSPDVKENLDSEAVTAQLNDLRVSVNEITAALDNLPGRIVAEIQVNDPKEDVSFPKYTQNASPAIFYCAGKCRNTWL